jgi:hypothetical protein
MAGRGRDVRCFQGAELASIAKLVTTTAPKTASTRNNRIDGSGIRWRSARPNLIQVNAAKSRAFHAGSRPPGATAPVFSLARAIQAETTCGESPFTQTIRVALAALCQCYNSAGNHRLHGLIGTPEAVNVFYGSVVGIGHHRNVRLFKDRIADKWNYRRHGFPQIWLPPNMASPHSGPLGSRIPRIAVRVCSKLTTLGAGSCPQAPSKADITKRRRQRLTRGGPSFFLPDGARLPVHRACHETACSTAACEVAAGPTPR